MKKSVIEKFLKTTSLILALALSTVIAACGTTDKDDNNGNSADTHIHEYATEYTFDSTNHWYAAVCEHYLEKSGKEEHSLTDGKCNVCDYKISTGLEFTLNDNKMYYTLSGLGTCTDTTVCIPSEYQNKRVTAISNGVFNNNSKITAIIIPKGVTEIKSGTFAYCTNLKKLQLPEGITKIGSSAFRDCTSLKYVEFPNTLATLEHGAFYKAGGLKAVTLPDSVKTLDIGAFRDCTSLESVILGDGVETVGDRAFCGCNKLKSVSFGKNVKSIGENAFESCTALAEISIPDIGAWCSVDIAYNGGSPFAVNSCALYNGEGDLITDLVIPSTVTEIKQYAFRYCKTIKSITLPSTVTKIGISAFSNCTNVEKISYQGTMQEWGSVKKGNSWKAMITKVTCVECSDGNATL